MPPLTIDHINALNHAATQLHLGPLAYTTAELDAICPYDRACTPHLPIKVLGRDAVEVWRWPWHCP